MILRLTLKRLLSQKLSSFLLILSLTLVSLIFFIFTFGMTSYKDSLTKMADSDLLVAGKNPNHLSIIYNTLYWEPSFSTSFPKKELDSLKPLGEVIPVSCKYTCYERPIVGVENTYIKRRGLSFLSGRTYLRLGEVVLGFKTAQDLNLNVGDYLINDPGAGFDVTKSNPVKLKVSGILAEQKTPDDKAIFTSLKTIWVIDGIGHEHKPEDENSYGSLIDLTGDSLENLHFHGEEENYPVTGAILYPESPLLKAEFIAKSKNSELALSVIAPKTTLISVIERLSGVSKFFQIVFSLILLSLLIVLIVLILQSSSLRKSEYDTYFSLGIPKNFYYKMILAEWILVFVISLTLGFTLTLSFQSFFEELFTNLGSV